MAQRLVVFEIESLKDLLVHYTDGAIPLDSTAVSFDVNQFLQRYIGIVVQSSGWPVADAVGPDGMLVPLHIRYEGNRVLKIERPQDAGPESWSEYGEMEAPKRQA